MSRSRAMSAAEAANVTARWLVALATQLLVFPAVGLQATVAQTLTLSGAFTAVSPGRGDLLRRRFAWPGRAPDDHGGREGAPVRPAAAQSIGDAECVEPADAR